MLRPVFEGFRLATIARRALRGPLRPSWDVPYEAFAAMMRTSGQQIWRLPLPVQRKMLATPRRRPLPGTVHYEPARLGGVRSEWILPERSRGGDGGPTSTAMSSAGDAPTLLYMHGGGYALGSIATHRPFVARLALATKIRAVSIDYRRSPEHPFPAAADDAYAAYEALTRQVDPAKIVLAGESAGGGLVMATLLRAKENGLPLPAAATVISPWVDFTLRGASLRSNRRFDYVPRETLEAYVAAYATTPGAITHRYVTSVDADLSGLPPLFVLAGEAETLLDDARLLASRAEAAGVPTTLHIGADMIHAWPLFAALFPRCDDAIARIADFSRRHLAR